MKKLISIAILSALCAAPAAAAPATLTLKASPTVVAYAGSTTLSGVLSTLKSGQRVDIMSQDCGQGGFKKVTTVTTTSGGAFTYAAKPTMNTNYQAKQKAVTSPTAAVQVAPTLTLKKLARNKFSVSVTAAQTFVSKFVVFQRWDVEMGQPQARHADDAHPRDEADRGHFGGLHDQAADEAADSRGSAGSPSRDLLLACEEQRHPQLTTRAAGACSPRRLLLLIQSLCAPYGSPARTARQRPAS